MKTRAQIYGNEALSLLRNITMYKTLTYEQARRFYPGKEAVTTNLLNHLVNQGRIYRNEQYERYSASAECDASIDSSLLASVWVLLDFIDKVEYHTADDFPVKISFFSDGELYEIIYVPYEQEVMMNHAFTIYDETDAQRIIIVDCPEQIRSVDIPNATGFCSVRTDGTVSYFMRE